MQKCIAKTEKETLPKKINNPAISNSSCTHMFKLALSPRILNLNACVLNSLALRQYNKPRKINCFWQ